MLGILPLMIVPLILYNLGMIGLLGAGTEDPWSAVVFTVTMISGGEWSMTLGYILILVALVMLFIEVVKATRTSNASVVDHLLSTLVFIVFLIEFLLVRNAANSLFFTLMVIALVDVLAGFSVSLRGARRDFIVGGES